MMNNKLELLKKQNDSSSASLSPEHKSAVHLMAKYVRSKGLGMVETEVFRKDLIGMYQEADIRGLTPEEVLGSSSRDFCDRVLESGGKRKGEWIFYIFYRSAAFMLYFSLVQIFLFAYRMPINTGTLLGTAVYMIGSWLAIFLDRYYIRSGWRAHIPILVPVIVWSGLIIAALLLRRHYTFPTWFTVGRLPLIMVHLAVFLVLRLIWNAHVNRVSRGYDIQPADA